MEIILEKEKTLMGNFNKKFIVSEAENILNQCNKELVQSEEKIIVAELKKENKKLKRTNTILFSFYKSPVSSAFCTAVRLG